MKSSPLSLLKSHHLKQLRELVRAQQALHHNLVQLQQTVAGIATRSLMDERYAQGAIDGHEFLTIRLAAGADEQEARESLARAHATVDTVKEPLPPPELLEPG